MTMKSSAIPGHVDSRWRCESLGKAEKFPGSVPAIFGLGRRHRAWELFEDSPGFSRKTCWEQRRIPRLTAGSGKGGRAGPGSAGPRPCASYPRGALTATRSIQQLGGPDRPGPGPAGAMPSSGRHGPGWGAPADPDGDLARVDAPHLPPLRVALGLVARDCRHFLEAPETSVRKHTTPLASHPEDAVECRTAIRAGHDPDLGICPGVRARGRARIRRNW